MAAFKVRELTADDFFYLAEIGEKVSADLAERITENISEKQLGLSIMLTLLKYLPKEIKDFMALVTDSTPEELGKASFITPVKIAKELVQRQEFKDFLEEMRSIYSETLAQRLTLSATDTDGQTAK